MIAADLHPRRIAGRLLAWVMIAGGLAVFTTTVAVARYVRHEDEAKLVDDAVDRALAGERAIDAAVHLVIARLSLVAIDVQQGDVFRALDEVDASVVALQVQRSGRTLLELGRGERDLELLKGAPAESGPVSRAGARRLVVRAERAEMTMRALVDVAAVVRPPAGWGLRIVPSSTEPGPARAARRKVAGDDWVTVVAPTHHGLALRLDAPLASAQRAAVALGWRIMAWSALGLGMLLALGWIATTRLTRPLRRLALAVQGARGGHVSLPPTPPDEIGELADAIRGMSARVKEDTRVLQSAVRTLRRFGMSVDAEAVVWELDRGLTDALPEIDWQVATVSLADPASAAPALGLPVEALQRAITRLSPDDPEARRRMSQLMDRAETRFELEADGTLVVPLQTSGRDFGVVVGRGFRSTDRLPLVEMLCETALFRLRRLELRQVVVTHEKRALLGSTLAVLGRAMDLPASVLAANLHVLPRPERAEDAEALDDARDAADTLFDNVRQLAAFARNASETSLETIDLNDVLARVRSTALASSTGVAIQVAAPAGLQGVGDTFQTEQALLCLVQNAVDAAERGRGGSVSLLGGAEDGTLWVEVRDDGPGVDPAVRERLFEPFVSSASRPGSGLGLFLARTFARGHGGDVQLVETGRGGSVFRMTIRAKEAEELRSSTERVRQVLLLDQDDGVLRQLVAWMPPGVEASFSTSPREILDAVRTLRFDAVIAGLPIACGGAGDFVHAVRELAPGLRDRVVFFTDDLSGSVTPGLRLFHRPAAADELGRIVDAALGEASDAA